MEWIEGMEPPKVFIGRCRSGAIGRFGVRGVWKIPGKLAFKKSTIRLFVPADFIRKQGLTEAEAEEKSVRVLVHEITHWAQYLFLDGKGVHRIEAGKRGRARNDRLIERIAYEVSGQR